jgi:phage baseplate assembly protein W
VGFSISLSKPPEITIGAKTKEDEIKQNIAIILQTIRGTVPLYRDFGISSEIAGMPSQEAQNILVGEIQEKIEEYEPRVSVVSVTFQSSGAQIIPVVEVEYNNE